MISKIIQKEKEQQEKQLTPCDGDEPCSLIEGYCEYCEVGHSVHKQSLINLKEFFEEQIVYEQVYYNKQSDWVLENITELNKMIERYNDK